MAMDVVDYEIKGSEMQFVEVELDPGEAAIGEAGSLMFMDAGIGMDTVFGDGAKQQGGFFGKLLGAGKRLVTGESLFTTVYTNQAPLKQRVAFAAPYPGKILPMDLRQLGGMLICQKDSFLCAARGVSLGIALPAEAVGGLLRWRGLHHAEARGRRPGLRACRRHRGAARTAAGPDPAGRHRLPGGLHAGVNFEIQYVGKIKTALFGGEGLFFAKLTGPGTVWLQSLPFSRLASRVFAAAPQRGGGARRGLGSRWLRRRRPAGR
jgi:uncharacterized protein (AIM24 family)